MTGRYVRTDISLSRLTGGTHLSWLIDEFDLPWLLHVIRELNATDEAVVRLEDTESDGQLVVRVGEHGFAVEWSIAGTRSRLTRPRPGEVIPATDRDGQDGPGPADESTVDFDAVREAVEAFLYDRETGDGLRWVAGREPA